MYSYVSFNRKNINGLLELNEKRHKFNKLNDDFSQYYRDMSITKHLSAKRRIKLLKVEDKAIGYIWVSKHNRSSFYINSMYVHSEENPLEKYKLLIKSLKLKSKVLYNCEKNDFNYEILSEIGFVKKEGTYKMHINTYPIETPEKHKDIVFQQFEKGKHEEIRCRIQNEAFKNDSRIPLTKEDIYFDQTQPYYFDKGSILIRRGDLYIGYGQIIFNDDIPTIVNVGLLEKYRGMGYGKELMLYLLRILKEQGAKEVYLKVSAHNKKALYLYKTLGFKIINEIYLWEYKK